MENPQEKFKVIDMLAVMQHQESMIQKVQVIAGAAQVQTIGQVVDVTVCRDKVPPTELPRKRSLTLTAMQCHGSVDSAKSELISDAGLTLTTDLVEVSTLCSQSFTDAHAPQ